MKNGFDRLISRLDTAKGTISEPEEMSVETSKTKMEIKNLKKAQERTKYPRTVGQLQRV